MKKTSLLYGPIVIAVLAAILQVIDQLLCKTTILVAIGGFGWLSFQAWAMYFLAGSTVKGGVKAFLGYIVGMLASMLILTVGGWLAQYVGGFWAMPLTLLVLVIPIILLEKVPLLDLIPAIFIGAGAYFVIFSYISQDHGAIFLTETIYCMIGLLFGWITVALRK